MAASHDGASASPAEQRPSGTAARLGDSLDGQPDVTVSAPVNAAFQAVPADRLNPLLADVPRLTAVPTHHVVQGGRPSPARLSGRHTTLDNDQVAVEGAEERFTISEAQTLSGRAATVVRGNVPTANATVYFIDQVLEPPAG